MAHADAQYAGHMIPVSAWMKRKSVSLIGIIMVTRIYVIRRHYA